MTDDQQHERTLQERLIAAQESVEAHAESTGHDAFDFQVLSGFPTFISINCTACKQTLARVRAISHGEMAQAITDIEDLND